jgi:uncharacterized protein (DUF427 family)
MPRASWKGVTLAESDATEVVEGNHYFPPDSIKREHFKESPVTSLCPWKGTASYYDIEVDGEVNQGAAWYYQSPKPAAQSIAGYIAFWRGVTVE